MKGSRDYCFTWNNYTDEDEKQLQDLGCNYIIYGKEVGESGTPHLQGFVRFEHQKTLSAVKKVLPKPHFEARKGTFKQAVAYCKKEDNQPYERGEPPMDKEEKGKAGKRCWDEAFVSATEGRLDELSPRMQICHGPALKRIAMSNYKPQTLDYIDAEWHWGDTKTGKSRTNREKYPNAYIKDIKSKFWDGYDVYNPGHEVVIWEDVDPSDAGLIGNIKRCCDHYPFRIEEKGVPGYMIRPKKNIFTSNHSIRDIGGMDADTTALVRRFKVHHYNKPLSAEGQEKEKEKEQQKAEFVPDFSEYNN